MCLVRPRHRHAALTVVPFLCLMLARARERQEMVRLARDGRKALVRRVLALDRLLSVLGRLLLELGLEGLTRELAEAWVLRHLRCGVLGLLVWRKGCDGRSCRVPAASPVLVHDQRLLCVLTSRSLWLLTARIRWNRVVFALSVSLHDRLTEGLNAHEKPRLYGPGPAPVGPVRLRGCCGLSFRRGGCSENDAARS